MAEPRIILPDGFQPMSIKNGVWPIPIWMGRSPFISQGFNPLPDPRFGKKHGGVDIMFVRLPNEPAKLPEGVASKNPKRPGYFMPSHTIPVLAAWSGKVVKSGKNPLGHSVVIDHGNGISTFYQHMTEENLAPEGVSVSAGDIIGMVGNGSQFNPDAYPLNHLHFEIWPGGKHALSIDPEPILRGLISRPPGLVT